jgi:hypothetical protein
VKSWGRWPTAGEWETSTSEHVSRRGYVRAPRGVAAGLSNSSSAEAVSFTLLVPADDSQPIVLRELSEGVTVSVLRLVYRQSGVRLAQVGFLLILIAGIWLAAAEIPLLEFARARKIVAGVLLAIGGLLLIIATQWVQFG